jgi:uncharacterized membrane protein
MNRKKLLDNLILSECKLSLHYEILSQGKHLMPLDILTTPITPKHLYSLARANILSPNGLEYALRRIGTVPDAAAWQRFINNLLLLLGTTLLLAGILFFFAYNWAYLSRFLKFAVLEFGVLSMAMFASWQLRHLSGQAALLAAAVLLGVLLAVYGQIYQTGADAFGLFLAWAILISPWVLVSQFAPLWLLLLLLLNLSLILYWEQVIQLYSIYQRTSLFLILFMINTVAMLAWEYAYKKGVVWLQGKWISGVLFAAMLTAIVIPTLFAIVDFEDWQEKPLFAVTTLLYISVTTLAFWYYRYKRRDLLLLAMSLLGVIVVFSCVLIKVLPMRTPISWLILALLVIGQATLASQWLRKQSHG